ncbi:hypothetical protein [Erwinia sp. JH02]|uniref:RipA family octameric membrane protein n=1 Tax=Erwinia sp. JH02 TaxID=2733394 RepID=UPI001487BEF7|nr:hypothetical protein [Erwinia sp. JH02]NNS06220.1 hypothetical protein [Erwinia sp. JH02]
MTTVNGVNPPIRVGLTKSTSEHFEDNKAYFKSLLSKDFSDLNTQVEPEDLDKIKEAYEKAHKTREFEIGLYWQRLNYLWAITAILFAGWGVLVNNLFPTGDAAKDPSSLVYLAVFLVSIIGVTLTILSSFITAGGKYWQEVWEYHLLMLEPFESGKLYGMQFQDISEGKVNRKRPSISRSVHAFHIGLLLIWTASAALSIAISFKNNNILFLSIEVFSSILILAIYFIVRNSVCSSTDLSVKPKTQQ